MFASERNKLYLRNYLIVNVTFINPSHVLVQMWYFNPISPDFLHNLGSSHVHRRMYNSISISHNVTHHMFITRQCLRKNYKHKLHLWLKTCNLLAT